MEAPQVLGHYALIKAIGKGAYGECYLCHDTREDNGPQLVLKTVKAPATEKDKKETEKEIRVLKVMEHPYVVRYIDSFILKGSDNLHIVMEYANGGDLYHKIKDQKLKRRYFLEDTVLDWLVQLCLALKHVHDRKILHRDIKTRNIFLNKEGDIKLGDFGICRTLDATGELATTTVGTPYYISPEMCHNQPYDAKSDVWALAVVMYEVICLRRPFEAKNLTQLVIAITKGKYAPIPECFSAELAALLDTMFTLNPKNRPSVHDLLEHELIQERVRSSLSEIKRQEEFSHTILHNFKLPEHTSLVEWAESASASESNANQNIPPSPVQTREGRSQSTSSRGSSGRAESPSMRDVLLAEHKVRLQKSRERRKSMSEGSPSPQGSPRLQRNTSDASNPVAQALRNQTTTKNEKLAPPAPVPPSGNRQTNVLDPIQEKMKRSGIAATPSEDPRKKWFEEVLSSGQRPSKTYQEAEGKGGFDSHDSSSTSVYVGKKAQAGGEGSPDAQPGPGDVGPGSLQTFLMNSLGSKYEQVASEVKALCERLNCDASLIGEIQDLLDSHNEPGLAHMFYSLALAENWL